MKLILDEPPPIEHHSTSVTTKPEVRKVRTTSYIAGGAPNSSSTKAWDPVNPKSMKLMIAQAIKDEVKPGTLKPPKESGDDNESSSSSDDDATATENVSHSKEVSSVLPQDLAIPQVSATANEIAKILPTVEKSPELYQSHWVYAIDSGGQASFLDVAPALLRYNPVSILTLKLNEKLTDRPKFYFSFKGELIGQPVQRQMTNLQLLESSFRSLSSVDQPHSRSIHITCSSDKPSLLVLGTFYDKLSECIGETLDDKNAALSSTLQHFRDIIYCENDEEIIFPINTIARSETEREMAELIRNIVCQSYIEADIPARWFLFKIDLEDLETASQSMQVVSKKECLRIGEALKMDHRDVEAALMYYHDLTIFLYFPKVLPNVVFIHPQPLFDKLSELISISFADAVAHLRKMKIILPPDVHRKLKCEGIFKGELLDRIPDGFSPDFTANDFLKLMEDIFVVAPLPEKGMFFLPCVLPSTSLLENVRDPFMKNMDSLVLTWNMKPLPNGLFPALIVNLLRRPVSPTFQLLQPLDACKQSMQYRNAIHLTCIGLGGGVLLVDAIYWLEIHYSGLVEKCPVLRNAILEGVGEVVKKFNYKPILSVPQERFLCSICLPPRDHLCRPDEDKVILTCCRDGISTAGIDLSRQLPWIDGVITEALKQNGQYYINKCFYYSA